MRIGDLLETFANPNNFSVQFMRIGNNNGEIDKDITVYAKSVNLPTKELKQVEFIYDGVKYPLAREVAYKNTTEITFYMDNKGNRDSFIKWMDLSTKMLDKQFDNKDFYMDVKINHMGGIKGDVKAGVYTFHYMFPTEVSEVTLSSESSTILEYTVTFAYGTWESELKTPERSKEIIDPSPQTPSEPRSLADVIDGFIAGF